ncbi:MAG: hypothetical protein LC122_13130 [Chitinophagales bacterium]|nr:hypothetical protein [Chitinophagales bacterium]
MPYYLIKTKFGLDYVGSEGDGTNIKLKWYEAFPTTQTNSIAYNIYYSTTEDGVFFEPPKYVSVDNIFQKTFLDFVPGQLYYFAIRPIEYNSLIYDYNLLVDAGNGLKAYQQTFLKNNITADDLVIPVDDVTGFPSFGTLKIGYELIEYSSVDTLTNTFNVSLRGARNTIAKMHNTDGYDGSLKLDPTVMYYLADDDSKFDKVMICQSRFEYPKFSFTQADGYKQVTKDLLYTDLSISDEQNIDFPSYSYVGWHRTDPSKLIAGECIGSYIGGYQFCADGYANVGTMIRNISMQDANNQRQEMLLEQTGEPVVLLRKQTTGIVCTCYQPSSEYHDDRCPYCFGEGTIIRTSEGFEEIQNIKIGDKVLSANGEFNKVVGISKQPYSGKLRSIKTSSSVNPIIVTPNHEFVALRGSHKMVHKCGPNTSCKAFISRGDGLRDPDITQLKNGKYYLRSNIKNHKRKSLGTFNCFEDAITKYEEYNFDHFKPGHELKWEYAKDLNKNDWIVSKWNTYENDIKVIEIPKEFQKNTKLGEGRIGDTVFEVNEEFLWICGLYIAEGSSGKRSIQFALHKDEIEYQNRVINYFKSKNFNPKLRTVKNSKGVVVEVNSTSLSKWFPALLGKLCYNKKIPNEFTTLPKNKIRAIIDGIFCGDGCKRDNIIAQTSKYLAIQLVELLHKIGKMPMVSIENKNKLTKSGNKLNTVYHVSYEPDTYLRDNRVSKNKGKWKFNEHMLTMISNIDEIDYDGYVYNLEIENDHSYVVENILVHNCFGTKFVLGYDQYFNPRRSDGRILVRFSPGEDDVKVYEAGLESEFNTECWTLTVPTIKDRDVIVRYDLADNEEYRYEVLSVTRQRTFLRQEGGQKFRVQRIRKTDPVYQIRVFKNTSKIPETISTSFSFSNGIPLHKHDFVINEGAISNMSQLTSISQGHNHLITYNSATGKLEVSEVLGHKHEIII